MKSLQTFSYFAKAYPGRSALMIASLVVGGFFEGIGVVALLPLMAILTEKDQAPKSFISKFVEHVFGFLGLEVSIIPILIFIVCAILLKAAVTMLAMVQVSHTTSHVCADLRLSYIRNVLKARWSHFLELQAGASANALATEAQRASVAYRHACYAIAWGIQVLVYAGVALMVSWKLTLATMVAGGIMIYVLGGLIRKGRKAGKDQTITLNAALARMTDTLFGAKPLKAMGREEHLIEMMRKDARDLEISQNKMELAIHAITMLSEPIMVVFVAIGLYAILTFGNLEVPELLFLTFLFLRIITRISSVQAVYMNMVTNESALSSILAKTRAAQAQHENSNGTLKPTLTQGITVKNITFGYGPRKIFDGLNLDFPAHGFFVIFGPSGEGKTTLLDLIIGLYVPDAGCVEIDNQPLPALDLDQWRAKIGYVPQDVLLFHDTIRNNIALNDPLTKDEDIIGALKAAGAWDFVQATEAGLDTIVGERGAKLSGGQRQRIAIARALVNHPALLVLDEATSALDKTTERDILTTVKALSKDILVLSISHNATSLGHADSVFKLQGGKLEILSPQQIATLAA